MKSALVMHGYRIIQRAFNSDIHFFFLLFVFVVEALLVF